MLATMHGTARGQSPTLRGLSRLTKRWKLEPQTTPNLRPGAEQWACLPDSVPRPGRGPTASGPQAALWACRGCPGKSERRLPGAHAHPRCGLAFFFFFLGRPWRLRTGCGMGSEAPASGSGGAVRSSQGEAAAAAASR